MCYLLDMKCMGLSWPKFKACTGLYTALFEAAGETEVRARLHQPVHCCAADKTWSVHHAGLQQRRLGKARYDSYATKQPSAVLAVYAHLQCARCISIGLR